MSVILLIRKRTWLSAWLLICLGCLSAIFWSGFRQVSVPVSGAEQESGPAFRTVVIDPGHGGQDGGAVAPEHMEKIEAEMRKICKEKLKLERFELPREEAVKFMEEKGEPYKVELIQDLPEDAHISFYKQGEFTDLCGGLGTDVADLA